MKKNIHHIISITVLLFAFSGYSYSQFIVGIVKVGVKGIPPTSGSITIKDSYGTSINPTTGQYNLSADPGTVITLVVNAVGYSIVERTFMVSTGTNTMNFWIDAVADYDDNEYSAIEFGDQIWMVENLKVEHLSNGYPIPLVGSYSWSLGITTPARCWYGDDPDANKATYGALYNWYAASNPYLCPTDWHVPSDGEWTILSAHLGGNDVAGGKMKESGVIHWTIASSGATNQIGFTALPGGSRIPGASGGEDGDLGLAAYFWSSTGIGSTLGAEGRKINNNQNSLLTYPGEFGGFGFPKNQGFSIRCVKNPMVPTVITTALSDITSNSAQSGGNITSNGSSPISNKGICWNTTGNPTTSNSRTDQGSGIGFYTSSLTDLTPNTTYHVRAYAINSTGTGYGDEVSFMTCPAADISYTGSPWCSTAGIQNVTVTGTGGGTFSALPAGLNIDSGTGAITPSTSTAGTYTVTYTIAAAGGCGEVTATAPVTITSSPVATFSYSGTPYCSNAANPSPTFIEGGVAGTFSSTAGLVFISTATGQVNLSASTPGTYTVINTIAAAGGCDLVTSTSTITISAAPTATISYAGSPWCSTAGIQNVTVTGTAGGTFSALPAGLNIDSGTGAINPSASTAGTYTITYTIAASGGCGAVTTTAPVTITSSPVATFSYSGTPYCSNAANPSPTFIEGGVAGTFSSTPGLVFISTATGQVNLSASTPGTYTVINTIAAAGGCDLVTSTSTITISAAPTATISYAGSPWCSTAGIQNVTLTGTGGGTFSALPAGLNIDSGTGAITPSTSTAGTYTVTYTIAAAGGCGEVTATAPVTITALPVTTFSYSGTPYCSNAANPSPTFIEGGVAGTFSSTAGLVFISTATGQVNLSASTPGTYTVINTIAAAGGCDLVTSTSTITISAAPTATISYAGSPWCSTAGIQNVTLTGAGGGTFSALPAGLNIDSGTGAITPSTSTAGTYTVTYTIAAAGGCDIIMATTTVLVNLSPVAAASNNGPVPEGSLLSLTGGPDEMSAYLWTGPNGFSSTLQSPIVSNNATASMSGVYTLTVTNSYGCQNTTTTTVTIGSFTVTITNDDGPGSLRNAIELANSTTGVKETITFNILGEGPHTIQPLTPFPAINDPVIIDGYSQPGANPATESEPAEILIEIVGNASDGNTGMVLDANNSTISGLSIKYFRVNMAINGNGNTIKGNYFTGMNGTVNNLYINGSENEIGGRSAAARNVITLAEGGDGIEINNMNGHLVGGNRIIGNYIGIDPTGEEKQGNDHAGIRIVESPDNTIGGPDENERNVISGNINGISISGVDATGNRIEGNYIGTNASGTKNVGNDTGLSINAPGNYIGGVTPGAGNLISGNGGPGGGNTIKLLENAIGNFIQGNLIGTDRTGFNAIPNQFGAVIWIQGGDDNLIGGLVQGAGNIISGNLENAIEIANAEGNAAEGNKIQGNYIGTDISGNGELANGGSGIVLGNNTNNTLVGGNEAGAGNIIAFNEGEGVIVPGTAIPGTGNAILTNSIHSNGGLGIDLGNDGVTPNDEAATPYDSDTGPNHLQNFPVLESISFSPGVVDISGTLNSESDTEYTIEFFANLVPDENDFEGHRYGEGETYLGSETVTTGPDGNASFTVTFPIKSSSGQVITATATDPDSNTSEFSRAVGGFADQEVGTEWPLHYKYNRLGVENITNGSDITAVINSFQTWSDVPTADVEFVNDGPTDDRYASIDGVNLVSFVDDQFPWAPGILAYAAKTIKMDADGQAGQIIDADIIVNPDFVNSLTGTLGVADEGGTPDYYDIQSVITHEIGHLLGLIHTGVVDATMFFWINDGTTDGRSLEPDDVAWVSYKYPGDNYASTYGTLSGDVTYGYDPYPKVAGALVTAENTAGIQFHSYSDAEGSFTVPVERNNSYTIHIQPLDGDVNGFPMKPGNISSYVYSNTIYTDYPNEFYSGIQGELDETTDGTDRDAEVVDLTDGPVSITTNPDLTPPDIVLITPNDGQPVKVMPDIIISFSEPVETTSLSDATCWLESGGDKHYGNFTELGGNSDVILFSPNEPLAYNTTYVLYLAEYVDENTPCITDLKGNGLESNYPAYSIITVSEDGTSPVITGIKPEDEAEGVFVTDKILVFFSEPMNKTSVESGFTLGCDGTPDVDGAFSWKNENTLMTFTPARSLEESTEYTITFAGTITDLSNNPMDPADPTTFTTVLASAPEIVYLEPGNQIVTGVSMTTPVVLDFSEPINPSTVNSTTFKLMEGTDQVSGTYEFLNDNSRVVFRPDADLEFNTNYEILLTDGIMDVSASSLHFDPDENTAWFPATFTTAGEPSVPYIYYIDPPSGVSGSLVTIAGEGFDPVPANNSVMFCDMPATIKSATLTSLTVEVPKGALSGMVTVTTGGTTTDPGYYFYVIPQSLDPCENVLPNTKTGSKSRDVDVTGDGALAYVTNSGSNSVSVIDLTTTPGPTWIDDIEVGIGESPLKIDINPAGTRAYVTNFGSHTVSVIDLTEGTTKNQVIDVINVGINPYGVVVTPGGDRVYVSNYSSNNLSVIDADPNSGGFDHVVANVNTGTRNRDLAVTGDAGLVLVAGDNGLTIVNSDPADLNYNCVIANSSSGSRTRDVGVSGDAGIAFVTTEEGQLLIIDIFPSSDFFGAVLANVSTGSKARDVKISGDGLHVYVTTENNDVLVYQINPGGAPASPGCYAGNITLTLHETIPGVGNEGLVIDPKNERLIVVDSGSEELNVIQICCGPISPEKAIGDLIITVQNMIRNGSIPKLRGFALIISLNRSLVNLNAGRTKLAIADLRIFIGLVKTYIRNKYVSNEQGQELINSANAIINQLKGIKSGEEETLYTEDETNFDQILVSEIKLGNIYPNPSKDAITINYEIAESELGSEKATIQIFDVTGRLVSNLVNENLSPGRYTATWNGKFDNGEMAPKGFYFIRLSAGTTSEVKQIMLVR